MIREWVVQDQLIREVLGKTGKAPPAHRKTSVRDRLRAADARADRAEAAVAALTAGESDQPAPEGQELTPAEWIHRWNRLTPEQRIAKVEAMFAMTAEARAWRIRDANTDAVRELAQSWVDAAPAELPDASPATVAAYLFGACGHRILNTLAGGGR